MNEGNHIILVIDLNKHIIHSNKAKQLHNIRLVEAIIDKHHNLELVPTYQRGQVPIDSIFISSSLLITSGGYFLLDLAPTNHCTLWIKIKISLVFGYILY